MAVTDRAVFAILVVLALLYLQQQDPPPPPRKRARRDEARPPAPGGWGTLLARVKWDTIANMLRWKSEVSQLDGILQGVDDLRGGVAPAAPAAHGAEQVPHGHP